MTKQRGERAQRVKWWLLKYEFPQNTKAQTTIDGWLSPLVDRSELGSKLVRFLAAERLTMRVAGHSWRIADVTDVDENTISFRLHRSTGIDYLAAENDDGTLGVVFGSRYFAEALLYGEAACVDAERLKRPNICIPFLKTMISRATLM